MATKFKPLAMGFHSHVLSPDSCSSATSKIINASQQGRIADVVTDHGTMSAIAGHYLASQKLYKEKKIESPIQSIHGCEIYLIDEDRPPKVYKNGKTDPQYYHLTIHFKTQQAYEYFCRLSPIAEGRAVLRYGVTKPLIYFKELEDIAGQITIGSGCLGSPVHKNLLAGRKDLAIEWYERLANLAGPGNYFVELMPHLCTQSWYKPVITKDKIIEVQGYFGPVVQKMDDNALDPPFEPDPCTGVIDLQRHANALAIELASKHHHPCVISLDDHFSKEEEYAIQSVMLGNGGEKFRFYNKYFAMDSDQAADIFKEQLGASDRDISEWIDNGYKFVDLFKDYKFITANDRILLPNTEMIYNVKTDSKTKLYELIEHHGRMPPKDDPKYLLYKDRLEYEISVLGENGIADFLPYVFVVEDAANYAASVDMLFNVRGSSGASIILYLLRISITDPIKYDLPFERFLTLGRIKAKSLPDVDSDWPEKEPIIAYLQKKYGENMGLISTDSMMRLKSSILDVERAHKGKVPAEVARLAKALKGGVNGQSDKDWLFGYTDKETGSHVPGFIDNKKDAWADKLRKYRDDNPEIWNTIMQCIGVVKSRGVHAGGVVITPGPIANFFPMIKSNIGLAVAYEMKALEASGGIKFDFLGVTALKALQVTFRSIRERFGIKLKWEEPEHDPKVFKHILCNDKLAALYQLNTQLIRPFAAKLQPQSVKEMANLTALGRPGTLAAPSPDPNDGDNETAATYYVKCSRGERDVYLIHEDLRPIIGDTFGVILYQEQLLKIFRDIAGYTYEVAEGVRRAVGKKDKKELELHSGVLRKACLKRGWTEDQAKRLMDSIMASSAYSFNLAHSISVSIVAYYQAWLKYYYPLDYWKGELQISDADEIKTLLPECGHLILDVSATKSHHTEWLIEGDKLRAPLSLVKQVGGKAADRLYAVGHGHVPNNLVDAEIIVDDTNKDEAQQQKNQKKIKTKQKQEVKVQSNIQKIDFDDLFN